jgi:hypothetical protein
MLRLAVTSYIVFMNLVYYVLELRLAVLTHRLVLAMNYFSLSFRIVEKHFPFVFLNTTTYLTALGSTGFM